MILGTQQFRPTVFAQQIALDMDNAWGILRVIIDTCMKLPEGKYLLLRDPNKVMLLDSHFLWRNYYSYEMKTLKQKQSVQFEAH